MVTELNTNASQSKNDARSERAASRTSTNPTGRQRALSNDLDFDNHISTVENNT